MRRTVALGLLVAGLLLAPLTAAAAPGLAGATAAVVGGGPADGAAGAQANPNGSISPGERLAGAIGAEGAELDGEISERSFGAALAAAETNDSAAAVVAQRLDLIESRLDRLEARNATLAAQYENGSLGRGAYAARAAAIEAQRASLLRQLDATAVAADRLPAAALAANDVDSARIEGLRTRASELGGGTISDLARSIAGPNVGNGVGPGERGPDEIPGLDEDGLPGERGPEDGPGEGDGPDDSDGNGNASDGDGGTEADGDAGEETTDSGDTTDGTEADGSGTDTDS